MIALLIIPAAAARFWTHQLRRMIAIAALIGGLSGYLGAAFSASAPNLPAGAIIVVTAGLFLVVSVVFGSDRGLLTEARRFARYGIRLSLHRLLVACSYEIGLEALHTMQHARRRTASGVEIDEAVLHQRSSWNRLQLRLALLHARRAGLIDRLAPGLYELTRAGVAAALRAAQNHELQHLYLREYPESAQGLHQRDEEQIEDYIDTDVASRLRAVLEQSKPHLFNRSVDAIVATTARGRGGS
jgi:manganese/zinc/iron transport system permease protein